MSDPLPTEYLEVVRGHAKRANGSARRLEEWPVNWVAVPTVILQLCGEIDRLRAERDELFSENGKLGNTLGADNLRLRALIADACKVFEHYDLPEHAFHYRRAVEQSKDPTP